MKTDRELKIERLVNKVFVLTGNKSNEIMAEIYAEELSTLNIKISSRDIIDNVINNHTGFGYPPIKLFLDGLGITTKDNALQAWESIQETLPYMKDSTNYKSDDKTLISTLARIGVKVIMQMQESVDMYTNKINSYQLSSLKEQFLRTYKEFEKSGEVLLLENGKGNVKMLTSNVNREERVQIESKKPVVLQEFNENVKNVARNILGS